MARTATGLRQAAVAAALVVLMGGLAVALRPPWHDELFTRELAARPVGAIVAALRLDSGPPGHYLLARTVWLAGGHTVRALRIPSLIAVAAAAAVLAAAAARRYGNEVGWWIAVAGPLHPVALAAASEARAYGLLLATATAAALLVSGRLTRSRTVVLAGALAASCWIHALGLVLALGIAATALFLPRPERVRVWAATGAALFLFLPWVPVMVQQPPAAIAWMADHGPLAEPAVLLVPVAVPLPVVDLSPWLDLAGFRPLLLLSAAAGVAVLTTAVRRHRLRPLAVLWAATAGTVLTASALLRPLYYPGRRDALWLAPALLAAAALVPRARSTGRTAAAAACLLAAMALVTTMRGWASRPPTPAVAAAEAVSRLTEPGDLLVTTGWWALELRWRLGGAARRLEWRTYPPAAAAHPGWYHDAEATPAAARELLRELRPFAAAGRRIWLLRSPPLPSDRNLEPVVDALGLVPRARGGGLWSLWGAPPESHIGSGGVSDPPPS